MHLHESLFILKIPSYFRLRFEPFEVGVLHVEQLFDHGVFKVAGELFYQM